MREIAKKGRPSAKYMVGIHAAGWIRVVTLSLAITPFFAVWKRMGRTCCRTLARYRDANPPQPAFQCEEDPMLLHAGKSPEFRRPGRQPPAREHPPLRRQRSPPAQPHH